jgi:Uma2 family endonuclease
MAQTQTMARDLYAELENLPANRVGEIVFGSLYAHPRPATEHGMAATDLIGELIGPFRRGKGGPGGWIFIGEQELHLGPHVVVPDILGWRRDRFPTTKATPYSVVPPDWLCEVLSPATKHLDRFQKLRIYAEYGVRHCWYVDPTEKTLEVFILSGSDYIVGPAFAANDPVTAPPFEIHTFDLGILWGAV